MSPTQAIDVSKLWNIPTLELSPEEEFGNEVQALKRNTELYLCALRTGTGPEGALNAKQLAAIQESLLDSALRFEVLAIQAPTLDLPQEVVAGLLSWRDGIVGTLSA